MGSRPSFACFGLFSSGIKEALEGLSGNLMSRTAMDDAHTLSRLLHLLALPAAALPGAPLSVSQVCVHETWEPLTFSRLALQPRQKNEYKHIHKKRVN